MTTTVTAADQVDIDAAPKRPDESEASVKAASAGMIRAQLAEAAARKAWHARGFPAQRLHLIDQAIGRWARRRRRLAVVSTVLGLIGAGATVVLTLIGVHPLLAFGAIYPLTAVRWWWTRSVYRHHALERVTLDVRRALC